MGFRNWLKSLLEQDVEPEEDEEDTFPIEVELEERSNEYDTTFDDEFQREVELVQFSQSGPTVVEFDETYSDGLYASREYSIDTDKSSSRLYRLYGLEEEKVTTINGNAVEHRSPLGSYTVTKEVPVRVRETYTVVTNLDELKEKGAVTGGTPNTRKVCNSSGVSYMTLADHHGHPNSFSKLKNEDVEGDVYWSREYEIVEVYGPTETTTESSLQEIVDRKLSGGTQGLSAIDATGSHVIPDSNIGGGDDVKEIPSGEDEIVVEDGDTSGTFDV